MQDLKPWPKLLHDCNNCLSTEDCDGKYAPNGDGRRIKPCPRRTHQDDHFLVEEWYKLFDPTKLIRYDGNTCKVVG